MAWWDDLGGWIDREVIDPTSKAVGDATGGWIGESSAERASKRAGKVSDEVRDITRKGYEDARGYVTPYAEMGTQAMEPYMQKVLGGAPEAKGFSYGNQHPMFSYGNAPEQYTPFDPSQIFNDPYYKFQVQQGEQALNRAYGQGSPGGYGGSARLKNLMQYGQDMAMNQMDKARDRSIEDYDIRSQREKDIYGRTQDMYDYGRDREQTMYDRALGEYDIQDFETQRKFKNDIELLRDALNKGWLGASGMSDLALGEAGAYGDIAYNRENARTAAEMADAEQIQGLLDKGLEFLMQPGGKGGKQ